jgi:hypothetical protein
MGCKEIYFIGVDLDWNEGYAENEINQKPTDAAIIETEIARNWVIEDLTIIKTACDNIRVKLYNANVSSIYNCIEEKMI